MNPLNSPFKFLDSYQKEDRDIFFGRDQEIDALYNALSGVKLLLVYGPSGSGKTSLIECGLRNQFSDADWFAITIRRHINMTTSVFSQINDKLINKINFILDPEFGKSDIDFGHAIENLFFEKYQPIYLIFDQFEELLISGEEYEKKDFFIRLNSLLRFRVPCRVLLVMREEFIGHLSEFESFCPNIFQHRFRLEKMRKEHVKEVIRQTLMSKKYLGTFEIENIDQLADNILSKLPDKKREIELTHVQVYLSQLWQRAKLENTTDPIPVLHEGLIKPSDNLEGVLDYFLKSQISELEFNYGNSIPIELLEIMVSDKQTKLQLSESEIEKELAQKELTLIKPLSKLLKELEDRRILRKIKSGDQTQYEISHDVLAQIVIQNLTEEMILKKKASSIYAIYEDRQGFFTQSELNYIRSFSQYKLYPLELEKKIKESELHLRKVYKEDIEKTQRRLRTVRVLLISAIIALVIAGCFAYALKVRNSKLAIASIELAKRTDEAQRALDSYIKADNLRKTAEINALSEKANIYLNLNQRSLAIISLRQALKIDNSRQDIQLKLETLISRKQQN